MENAQERKKRMSIEERKQERIRNYMKYRAYADVKGVTDYQVSKDTGIYNVTFSEWKNGKSQPKYDKLAKLAEYFGISVEALLG